jgi:hypothetical protein
MNVVAVLLLASISVPQVQMRDVRPALAQPHFAQAAPAPKRKGGKWYFARTGHAVYCFGPVMHVQSNDGVIESVATFCKGNQLLVPLKD